MIKGNRNCLGMLFGVTYKLVWCTSQCGALVGMVHKLARVENKSSSPDSRSLYWKC